MERNRGFITLIRGEKENNQKLKSAMKKTFKLECEGYYLLTSQATARNCYFENEDEVSGFIKLFKRYLGTYLKIHKLYMSSEGYEILVRVGDKKRVLKEYKSRCKKKKKEIKGDFVRQPWRIISEQMRIFGSVYAKWVNSIRDRSGGLVKERYCRYYFENESEFEEHKNAMKEGFEIRSQRNEKYQVSERWKKGVRWGVIRGIEWVESLTSIGFTDDVVYKMIKTTLSFHSTPP